MKIGMIFECGPDGADFQVCRHQNGHSYVDRIHAKKIVEALPDLTRLRRCETFVRFAEKVTGKKLQGCGLCCSL
jgi:predicted secreted Zn-dependent protease